ncbi:MAG TPA: hypothetical protein VF641_01645 [Methylobacterium sp.]
MQATRVELESDENGPLRQDGSLTDLITEPEPPRFGADHRPGEFAGRVRCGQHTICLGIKDEDGRILSAQERAEAGVAIEPPTDGIEDLGTARGRELRFAFRHSNSFRAKKP